MNFTNDFRREGAFPTEIEGRATREYTAWWGMRKRVSDDTYAEYCPSSNDVTVCDEWHEFQDFAKWHHEHYVDGWQLDKDMKIFGNREYSPSTCMFLPPALNSIVKDNVPSSKGLPRGVSEHGSAYRAICSVSSRNKMIGTYSTPALAASAYWSYKEGVLESTLLQYTMPEYHKDCIRRTFECTRNKISMED